MARRHTLEQVLQLYNNDPGIAPNISGVRTIEGRQPVLADLPADMPAALKDIYRRLGFEKLYSHQHEAWQAATSGRHYVVVTPTASGKSMCYQMPALARKLENKHSRTLLLFPTKALAQDQLAGFRKVAELWSELSGQSDLKVYNFDGDTPPAIRSKVRHAGDIVLSNPDMLHSGILPHHTNWVRLFENLDYVVIDELHHYKGVFGSHLANVIRRLKRICNFYGKQPVFMCASATIGNPAEHARFLLEEDDVVLIDKNGAGRGEKTVMFYNPPLVHPKLGVRRSPVNEAVRLAGPLIENNIPVILFCRSRNRVEILLRKLQAAYGRYRSSIRAYRGGYLPSERRQIEKDLREGVIRTVVSTNALELGVDIGSLTVSISVGFPGSVSSMWQQFGRAGRRSDGSLSVLIAGNSPLDQFLVQNGDPGSLSSPEEAIIHPDNLLIVSDHIKCATFELPFAEGEEMGRFHETGDVLEILDEEKVVAHTGNEYRWMSDTYPASNVSLRTAASENFVVCDITDTGREKIIAEMDYFAVPTMLHEQAIYMHQGINYFVEKLHWEDRRADVVKVKLDYYTDAQEKVEIEVLEDEPAGTMKTGTIHRGEIALKIKAVMFKKIKWATGDNVGWGVINTPEIPMHTQAAWLALTDSSLSGQILGGILSAAAYCLRKVAPYYVLCDPNDINVRGEVRSPQFEHPVLIVYDRVPGGILLSFRFLEHLDSIVPRCLKLVESCSCENGCPACIGPPGDDELSDRKKLALDLLAGLEPVSLDKKSSFLSGGLNT